MPAWDGPDCLRRLKYDARRPAVDAAITDPMWYDWLTQSQEEVYGDLFTRFPDFGYSAPQALVTADGGLTYTFGVDSSGDPIWPWGHVELYWTLQSIPDSPMEPGVDFLFEGGRIRFPGGRSRSFGAGGPWARFVADPAVAIDATHPPLLMPKSTRILLLDKTLERFAARPGSGLNPKTFSDRYANHLIKAWEKYATMYNMAGSQAAGAEGLTGGWWQSADVGTGDGGNQFDPRQFD
jgi:hypothetical protein